MPSQAMGILPSGLDEASSASHGSSSRPTANNAQSRTHYQPLSLADALARNGHDHLRALDELLAERNKFCLEASKLSTENMRLWNLMKRIRRENEELKAASANPNISSTGTRASPLSSASGTSTAPGGSSSVTQQTLGGSSSNAADPSSNITLLPSSSTAPSLVYPSRGGGSSGETGAGISSDSAEVSGSDALRATKHAPQSFYESATGHSDEEPRQSISISEAHGTTSSTHSTAMPADVNSSSSTAASNTAVPSSSAFAATSSARLAGLGLDDERYSDAHSESTDAQQSQQHASIMQRRAAVQAQRLAQLQLHQAQEAGNAERPGSVESHEFEAVDGSSIAASDGRSSNRASAEVNYKRGSGHPSRSALPSPLIASSPRQASHRSGSRTWSSDSTRNLFSPRLDASLLQYVSLSISGSNLRSAERGREIVSFYVTVSVDAPAGRVLRQSTWRVEKTYADILALDGRIKQKHGKTVAKRMSSVMLPDQSLFKDHAPSKVDRRKALLENYLCSLLTIPMPDKDDLCTFLCTDAMPLKAHDPDALTKDGFLTKKGQNLGRWVTRWYVLSETSLDHYESRGGIHLGSINICGAQIGRQQKSAAADSDENSYRHAFLILETKPPSSPSDQKQIIRHVLCAESDEERDEWVDVLVRAIGEADNREQENEESLTTAHRISDSTSFAPPQAQREANSATGGTQLHERNGSEGGSTAHGPSVVVRSPSGAVPSVMDPPKSADAIHEPTPQGGLMASQMGIFPRSKSENVVGMFGTPGRLGSHAAPASGVHHGTPAGRYAAPVGSPARAPPRSTSQDVTSSSSTGHGASIDSTQYDVASPDVMSNPERQSISRPSKDRQRPNISGPMNGTPIPTGYKFGGGKDESANAREANETKKRFWHRFGGGGGSDKASQPRRVFGVPLTESLAVSNVSEGLELPSVVYRCIEYLEHRNAASEEGIYRLSGSSAVIKNLKDRFNAQGDVNLLSPSEPFYDPHAIAGLLKQYLRELPSSVLTREMHLDFMRVNDIVDRRERVNELGSLVSMLPLANYSLLRTLCSHLIKVIERSDINKMTMRNVGIVFSPTLGIPAGVFALFLTEFDWVFFTDAKGEPAPRIMEEDIIPPDEAELGIGSAQQQMITQGSDGHASAGPRRTTVNVSRNNRNSLSYNESEADKLLGGPQARNRLSAYQEEYDHQDAADTIDATNPVDDLETDENSAREIASPGQDAPTQHAYVAHNLDTPWSPPSTGYAASSSVRSPPDMEITSVYSSSSRTPMSPASPVRATRHTQAAAGLGAQQY